jgi:putative tricarboxylic transport membrane protein
MDLFFNTFTHATAMLADPAVLLAIALGAILGSVAGAIPGMTTTLAVGIALPFTFGLRPITAVAFLIAITVGTNYGNSIPAILVGVPGTPSAVLTALDGYKLHQKGQSGVALGTQYIAALLGQLVSAFFFVAMVVPLAQLLYVFLAPELWALQLLGIVAIISLTGKNVVKGLVAGALGLAVTMIGPDPVALTGRFTFGIVELRGGLEIVPVVIGALAISELLRGCRQVYDWRQTSGGFDAKFPSLGLVRRILRPIGIGTVWGTIMGAIPGGGGVSSAFVAYQQAKLTSKKPEEYGEGSVEGLAANESAQNASQSGEMVPTFGFGIPGSGSMVLLLAALTVHGLVPGPLLVKETPEMLYASTAGLIGGTLVLALIGWPLAKAMLRLVQLDRSVVLVMALLLSMVGVYALRNAVFDVGVMIFFGLVGYFMLRYGYSVAAFALAVTLGHNFEGYLRHGILLTDNSFGTFMSRPVTAILVALSIGLLIFGIAGNIREARRARAAVATAGDAEEEVLALVGPQPGAQEPGERAALVEDLGGTTLREHEPPPPATDANQRRERGSDDKT